MKNTIDQFVAEKHVAIAGVSRQKEKWGNALMKELKKLGYKVYPVNPHADELEGEKCYHRISDLPEEVKSLVIATQPAATESLVKESKEAGIERVWMQRGVGKGSATPEAIQFCKDNQLDYVYGFCPMMFYGAGMHKWHLWLRKNIGRVPEEFKNPQ